MKYKLYNSEGVEVKAIRNRKFFSKEDEFCYPLKHYAETLFDRNRIDEMFLYLAKRITNFDMFWCKEFSEFGEKSEGGCGKMCKHYAPRNGKSGACKHLGFVYENTEEKYTLKIIK